MKKILTAVAIIIGVGSVCLPAQANTHLQVAGIGEVVIREDGQKLAINNDVEQVSMVFSALPMVNENGCDVAMFVNDQDHNDIASVTLCERNKPMVKLGRFYNGKKVGGWLIDASRYMWMDK